MFVGTLLRKRVDFAEGVVSSLIVLPRNGVEAGRVLEVINRLDVVSLFQLEETPEVVSARYVPIDALHLLNQPKCIFNFAFLGQKAEIQEESLLKIRAQKESLVEAFLRFYEVLLPAQVVEGETVEGICICLVAF